MRAPLTWGLRCQEQNLQASTIFLSGATGDVMSGKHGTSWQPYETLRQTPPAVPPVADGRSVSLISACGDGEPDAYSTRRYVGRGPDKQDQPRGDETITNSLSCALLETQPHSAMVFRRDSYNEHNTTRGGARFQCGSVIVATSLHAVDPAVDPNHDADIRIGSEAPKRRLPNLFPGMKAMGGLRATATSDRSWHRRLQAPGSPKLEFSFSPIACPVLLLLMPLTLTGSLRALNLCSHSARAR